VDELRAWSEPWSSEEPFPGPASAYHALAPALARLADRVDGEAVRLEAIGRTTQGQPIWAFHVTDPDVPAPEQVLVLAGIHALEWISVETALQLVDDLASHPPRGIAVTVIPCLNVDGRLKSEADARVGDNVYRRGNGAERPVDLNRDFAVNREAVSVWRHLLPGYHATTAAPLSQPESRALDALAARETYDRAASLHAFGGYLYYPWTGRWERPPDHADYVALGRAMEAAQGPRAYRTKQLSRWGFFFRANGTEIDHLYGRYGTKSFLVELTRSGFDLRRPLASVREYFRWYNPRDPRPHVERGVAAAKALIGWNPTPRGVDAPGARD
jgi:hypothetical protein